MSLDLFSLMRVAGLSLTLGFLFLEILFEMDCCWSGKGQAKMFIAVAVGMFLGILFTLFAVALTFWE